MLSRDRRKPSTAWLALLACAIATTPAAAAPSLRVNVDGVKAQEKINVESLLAIKRYADSDDIFESRIRRLHEQAPVDIARSLEPFGYYHVQVLSDLKQDGEKWTASYRVTPGEPTRLDTVTVQLEGEGAADTVLTRVVRNFPLKVGDPADHAKWELGKASIAGQAHARGYLDGKFVTHEIIVDPDRNAARLTIVYDTGIRYLFGPLRLDQDVLDQKYVDGYIKFEEGDSLDFDKLRAFQNGLRATNYFGRIEVEPDRENADGRKVPIDVTLEGAPPVKLDFGVSYGTDEGFGGTAGATWRRVNKKGHRADILIKVAQTNQAVTANYRIPWATPPTSILSFSTGYEREITDSRENKTFLVATSFAHLRGPWQETLALAYRKESFEVGPDEGTTSLFGPDLQWSLVRADDRIFTHRGFRARFGLQGAQDGILSSATYVQANADLKGILGRARSPHRLIGRFNVGKTWTDEFHELPASIRYYAGGAQSIRGYGYEELTPRDANGEAIGGQVLVETGLEYDYSFLSQWSFGAFYDLGGALEDFGDPLSSGVGVGIRWLSPVGLLRLDYALGLSLEGHPGQVHFMIGPDL